MSSRQRRRNNFENSKNQCLGKRDKSSAGRIDPRAVEICAVINELEQYYTTSSCAGRCFLYRGQGVKATDNFTRFRVSHDKIHDAGRYFDFTTLESDPTGGGDPIRSIGKFNNSERLKHLEETETGAEVLRLLTTEPLETKAESTSNMNGKRTVWLRFEPFILHVACRSLAAASALMNTARPTFKNVGLTTWKDSKYLVAIWGDEGLDMPLCTPDGSLLTSASVQPLTEWFASLVNERHERNWNKIDRFVQAVREMPLVQDDDDNTEASNGGGTKVPRSFDVIGDVALLHDLATDDGKERQEIGKSIMTKNKAIKVVVARQSNLVGTERAPGNKGLSIIAGAQRSPLITTHSEYGIRCVVDLNHTFFSPRMGPERLRICQQVARGEHVLVLFAGVCMDALQIAGRTEASSIVAVELNPSAVECARRAHRMLERNKAVKCIGAADRLRIVEGDVLEVVSTLKPDFYDRVLAPRPKEGSMDGDLGSGDCGVVFLEALLPVMKKDGGECHWYDFVADHEFPACKRTRKLLERTCDAQGLSVKVLHVAKVGSVAMRQLRVCLDFQISPNSKR